MGVNGIYGLSGSGLDIESMVKVGMMSKQNEYDKMQQKYTQNEWKKSSYLDLYSQVNTFNMSTLSQYKMSSNMNAHSATSSNESAVSVSANANALEMTHYVKVNSLASNAYLVGGHGADGVKTHNVGDKSSINLADALFASIAAGTNGKILAGGTEYDASAIAFQFSIGDATETGTDTTTTTTTGERENAKISGTFENFLINTNVENPAETAFEFTLGDGTTTATISFSYEELASRDTMMARFSEQIETAGLNINLDYDSDAGTFALTGKDLDTSINVTAAEDDESAIYYLRLLDLTDDNTNTKFVSGSFTATSTSGETENTETSTKITAAAQQTISVTYQQLLDGYTFNDLASAVNNLGTNVKAQYDSVQDSFSFYNQESGSANAITLTMASGDIGTRTAEFFNNLGLKQTANGEGGETAVEFAAGETQIISGTDASVTIDGSDYSDLSSNKVTIGGVVYKFKQVTSETATVNVTQDVDKIVDKVKSFVEDYNKLLSSLYELYNEKPNSDYKPLTQAQKDEMKDEQIEKWEKKAKEGLLYHDQTLYKIISGMRDAVMQKVEGVDSNYNNIFALGISTTGTQGQLTLNEDKLRAAIAEDPDSVYNVFAKLDKDDDYNANGVALRLGDVFSNGLKSIKTRAGTDTGISEDSDLNNLLKELQLKMDNFRTMMNAFEDKLYKKYDAMETSLAMLGAQLNYVSTAFGG